MPIPNDTQMDEAIKEVADGSLWPLLMLQNQLVIMRFLWLYVATDDFLEKQIAKTRKLLTPV